MLNCILLSLYFVQEVIWEEFKLGGDKLVGSQHHTFLVTEWDGLVLHTLLQQEEDEGTVVNSDL